MSKNRIFNNDLLTVAYWLRVNGPSSRERIESATGIALTPTIIGQGEYFGLLMWIDALNAYV
jgi:hypothetical protein